MNTQRATLESIAPTVEEAVEKGLAELGLTREAVEVEVLDEGSRGLFGLGTRHARIRLTVLGEEIKPVPAENALPAAEMVVEEPAEQPAVTTRPAEPQPAKTATDDTLEMAHTVVAELLERMGIRAEVDASYGNADDDRSDLPILVDIRGDDLSVLIGKRSETLNALQYIARLILSKELDRMVTLVLDVEGYRNRRDKQLRLLARRMADQAIKTGRRQVLEPMPPNERRIIHMELREHPQVITESSGDEPHRKVNIIPKD
ncbi:MAG TPA: RNA-binding cell elongation regulator Jag/EloR [Anaerolineales bacterium]|nr:RNA-binding cell elongation regulator Jag/EloR [Anaerolineales bacterium]